MLYEVITVIERTSRDWARANADRNAIIETFPDLYLRVSDDNRILESGGINARTFFGEGPLKDKAISDLPVFAAAVDLPALLETTRKTLGRVSQEVQVTLHGNTVTFDLSLLPITGGHVVMFFRDISA